MKLPARRRNEEKTELDSIQKNSLNEIQTHTKLRNAKITKFVLRKTPVEAQSAKRGRNLFVPEIKSFWPYLLRSL